MSFHCPFFQTRRRQALHACRVHEICGWRFESLYQSWRWKALRCGGLRQICPVVNKVLRQTRGREEMCTCRMRKGREGSDTVLCCGKFPFRLDVKCGVAETIAYYRLIRNISCSHIPIVCSMVVAYVVNLTDVIVLRLVSSSSAALMEEDREYEAHRKCLRNRWCLSYLYLECTTQFSAVASLSKVRTEFTLLVDFIQLWGCGGCGANFSRFWVVEGGIPSTYLHTVYSSLEIQLHYY